MQSWIVTTLFSAVIAMARDAMAGAGHMCPETMNLIPKVLKAFSKTPDQN